MPPGSQLPLLVTQQAKRQCLRKMEWRSANWQHRLRDQAIFEIRNCQIDDLTDPGLAVLKRRILAKSTDLLGKPLLRSVVFSDFSFVEQSARRCVEQ